MVVLPKSILDSAIGPIDGAWPIEPVVPEKTSHPFPIGEFDHPLSMFLVCLEGALVTEPGQTQPAEVVALEGPF